MQFQSESNRGCGIMDKELNFIKFLRVLFCFAVFTGHFFGIACAADGVGSDFLLYLRHSILGRTPLAFLHDGSMSLCFFYVLSGFLISYKCFANKTEKVYISGTNLIRKICCIAIPVIISIAIVFIFNCIINAFNFSGDVNFTELRHDILKLILCQGIPHYNYPMHFIYPLLIGYILSFSFLSLLKDNRVLRYCSYVVFFVWVLYHRELLPLFSIFMGMIFGEFYLFVLECKEKYSINNWPFLTFATVLAPISYHIDLRNSFLNYIELSICFSFILVSGCSLKFNMHTKPKLVLDFLDLNNFCFI